MTPSQNRLLEKKIEGYIQKDWRNLGIMILGLLFLLLVYAGPALAQDGNLWRLGAIIWLGLGGLGFMDYSHYSVWGLLWLTFCPLVMILGPLWYMLGLIQSRLRQE